MLGTPMRTLRGVSTTWPPPLPPLDTPPPEPPTQPAVPPSLPGSPSPGSNPAGTAGPGRRFLTGVIVGAVIGAVVAGGIVARTDDSAVAGASAADAKSVAAARAALLEHKGDIHQIVAAVGPSVVSVQTRSLGLGAFLQAVPQEGAGSGFVLSSDGVIVTNNHVVDGATTITVTLADGRKLDARVLGRDANSDLAVLKVDATGLPAVKVGRSDALVVGDSVVAIGNALALDGGPTVTQGIVSALDRTISAGDQGAQGTETLRHLLQTDAAINPGNSGGPLLNAAGEVVGINTAVAGDAQNIGFALAIDKALPIINTLKTGQAPEQPFLGLSTVSLTPAIQRQLGLDVSKGAVVASVTPGSGAELAGLAQGDVITRIGGRDVQSADDVSAAVADRKPGDQLDITIVRGGSTRTVTARIGRRIGGGG